VTPREMLRELMEDNKHVAAAMRKAHKLCDDHEDSGTASLLEVFIDETERRTWFPVRSQPPGRQQRGVVLSLSPCRRGRVRDFSPRRKTPHPPSLREGTFSHKGEGNRAPVRRAIRSRMDGRCGGVNSTGGPGSFRYDTGEPDQEEAGKCYLNLDDRVWVRSLSCRWLTECRSSISPGVASLTLPPPPASPLISRQRAASVTNGKRGSSSEASGQNSLRQAGQVAPRKRALAAHQVTSVC